MLHVVFVLRTPGPHREVTDVRMDAVPRVGDHVALHEKVRTVVAVTWDIAQGVTTVLLRDD